MEGEATGLEDDIWGLGGGVRAVACKSSSSDFATLQGSLQKHMGTGTPLGRGNGSKAFPVIRP